MGLRSDRGYEIARLPKGLLTMNRTYRVGTLAIATFFFVSTGVHAETRRSALVEAVQKAKPSVVSIRVPNPQGGKDSIGSGVIIDERGFIVTNHHVVGQNSQVQIRLVDGSEHTGKVVVREPGSDLAVVRIRTEVKLHALALAPVADLMEGETVIAIGHPYGYSYTVSRGIISALNRQITMPSGDSIKGLIQTDASINPGNSGGPLLNINGEFIGINTALREGANGIAFALNAALVKEVLNRRLSAQAIAQVEHGLIVREQIANETGDRQKVVVAKVTHAEVPLQKGDHVIEVGSRPVTNSFDLERAFWDKTPNEVVEVKVLREGRPVTVNVTVPNVAGPTSPAARTATPEESTQLRPTVTYPNRVRGVGPSNH